jgi:CBS domain-containing protein
MAKTRSKNVRDVMTAPAHACHARDSLERAAQLLWEHDCGCLPVVDTDGRVLAMITDRDICMAAYTRGRPLGEMYVKDSMSRSLVSCRPDDALAQAARRMSEHGIRRLAVTDEAGRLEGILSVNDLACACSAASGRGTGADPVVAATLQVLIDVSRHRLPEGARDPLPERPLAQTETISMGRRSVAASDEQAVLPIP